MEDFRAYSTYLQNALHSVDDNQINDFIAILYDAYLKDKTVFVIGNGGSAANASHFAQDLAKGTRISADCPKRIKALSLTDNVAFICALGNDDGFDQIFEQQLRTYSRLGDVLIAISGSGNSPNIIRAVKWANNNQLSTVGVTGFNGGQLREINQYSVHVPLSDMCTSETIHMIIFHYVVLILKEKIKIEESHGRNF
jgi:D-sedoheptulose 7-phosphate isomerase